MVIEDSGQEAKKLGSRKRRGIDTGDPELDSRLAALVERLPEPDATIALELIDTAVKLTGEEVSRLDRKILNSALKEMRYATHVFGPYRDIRKVSIFGSARTQRDHEDYRTAVEFARRIAKQEWMVITGAGPGIMEAGHEGAGLEASFGANIRLPFEAEPNQLIAEDAKLINFKYFFTRKLTFIKEAHAFVILPGGFGTMDEAVELLTLVQTGKSDLHPIVLLDQPGGTYWQSFDRFVREVLLSRGFVSDHDLHIYRSFDDPQAAVDEICNFYRNYHSQRIVRGKLILRLNAEPPDDLLESLSEEFSLMLRKPIEKTETSNEERRDDDVPNLPRIALDFDWSYVGLLRKAIDRLNLGY